MLHAGRVVDRVLGLFHWYRRLRGGTWRFGHRLERHGIIVSPVSEQWLEDHNGGVRP